MYFEQCIFSLRHKNVNKNILLDISLEFTEERTSLKMAPLNQQSLEVLFHLLNLSEYTAIWGLLPMHLC